MRSIKARSPCGRKGTNDRGEQMMDAVLRAGRAAAPGAAGAFQLLLPRRIGLGRPSAAGYSGSRRSVQRPFHRWAFCRWLLMVRQQQLRQPDLSAEPSLHRFDRGHRLTAAVLPAVQLMLGWPNLRFSRSLKSSYPVLPVRAAAPFRYFCTSRRNSRLNSLCPPGRFSRQE